MPKCDFNKVTLLSYFVKYLRTATSEYLTQYLGESRIKQNSRSHISNTCYINKKKTIVLSVDSVFLPYHIRIQSEFTIYNCVYVKEPLG